MEKNYKKLTLPYDILDFGLTELWENLTLLCDILDQLLWGRRV